MDAVTDAAPVAAAAVALVVLGLWVRRRPGDADPTPGSWSVGRSHARLWWFLVALGVWLGLVAALRLGGVLD